MSLLNDFAVLLLTHKRPNQVYTFESLRRRGYTGRIFLVLDDLDPTRDQYLKKYGKENVIVFDKKEVGRTFDAGDNSGDMRSIMYARNASFQIARDLGLKYFIQLDDDYTNFAFRFDKDLNYAHWSMNCLDQVFEALLKFYIRSGAHALAISQGGDFIGGKHSDKAQSVRLLRKCMNSFICSVDRPFQFVGRVNEDVNTYTHEASRGLLFLTANQVSLVQRQTQTGAGGMSDVYTEAGTYIKSFFSVMYQPSSVKVKGLEGKNARLHHSVNWSCTVPCILSESLKKPLDL